MYVRKKFYVIWCFIIMIFFVNICVFYFLVLCFYGYDVILLLWMLFCDKSLFKVFVKFINICYRDVYLLVKSIFIFM